MDLLPDMLRPHLPKRVERPPPDVQSCAAQIAGNLLANLPIDIARIERRLARKQFKIVAPNE
jgi:hypothetical protein